MYQKFLKNYGIALITNFTDRISNIVITIFIVRNLGDSDFGIWSLVFYVVLIIDIGIQEGLDVYYIKKLSQDKKADIKYYFSNCLVIKSVYYLSFIVPLSITNIFVLSNNSIKLIIILLSSYMFISLNKTYTNILISKNNFILDLSIVIFNKVILLTLVLLLYMFSEVTLISLAYSMLVSSVFSTIVIYSILYLRQSIPFKLNNINLIFLRIFLSSSLAPIIVSVVGLVNYSLPTFFLAHYKTELEIGYYNEALRIYSIMTIVPMMFYKAVLPYISSLYGDKKNILNQMLFLSLLIIVVSVLTIFFVKWNAGTIIKFIYGTRITEAINVLEIIVFSFVVMFFNYLLTAYIFTVNKDRNVMVTGAIVLIINAMLLLFIVPNGTIIEVAYIKVVQELVLLLILFGLFVKYRKLGVGVIYKD